MSKNSKKKWLIRIKKAFTKRDQEESHILGDFSEDRFESMVRTLIRQRHMPWLLGISRASASEDWIKKVDFRLRVSFHDGTHLNEFSIPVNVKSSFKGVEDFRKENPNSRVYPIGMLYNINLKWLSRILSNIYRKERFVMSRILIAK